MPTSAGAQTWAEPVLLDPDVGFPMHLRTLNVFDQMTIRHDE